MGNGLNNGSSMSQWVAMILGVAAIISPMWQSISSLNSRIEDLAAHGTPPTNTKIAGIEIKFTEIETQFRNLDERTRRMEGQTDEKLRALDMKLQLEVDKSKLERAAIVEPKIAVVEEQIDSMRKMLTLKGIIGGG